MTLFDWLKQRNGRAGEPGHSGGHESHPPAHPDGSKKCERAMRRELLYAIVRECMANAGIVSASYRFKVLSLDSRAHRFLVMIDLAGAPAGDMAQPAKVEAAIARIAGSRYGIRVMGVYWRSREAHEAHAPHPPATHSAPMPVAAEPARPQRGGIAAARTFDGAPKQGPQSYTLLTGFEDTEMPAGGAPMGVWPVLSDTQPGELLR